jgi:hypothetical protein
MNTKISLTINQQTEITNYINNYRKINQVGNLIWDNTISLFSQNWCDYLLINNLFQHSGTQLYGENLAEFSSDIIIIIIILLKLSIDAWYNEFKNPGFSDATGHFTCLVWKSSKKFGIGISIDPKA